MRSSLEDLENDFQSDWAVFEQKLEQALYIRHIRRMMWMGLTIVFLIGLFLGMNVYEYYDREYIPRSEQEENMEAFSSSSPALLIGRKNKGETVAQGKETPADENIASVSETEKQPVTNKRTEAVASRNAEVEEIPLSGESAPVRDGGEAVASSDIAADVPSDLQNKEETPALEGTATEKKLISGKTNEDQPLLSREDLGLLPEEDIAPRPLALFRDGNYSDGRAVYAGMALRLPVEVKNIEDKNDGPYVSPLQELNPWSYSINVYPNFTFRKMDVDEEKTHLIHRDFIDAVQAAENGSFSLNVGLRVSRRIGDITYLNSGLEYITYKNEVIYNFTNFRDAHINPQTGAIERYTLKSESELISFSDINTYNYLNIPLSISYQPWASDHIRLNIEAGGSYLMFLNAHGLTLNYKTLDIVDLSTRKFKRSMASFSFKVGASYYVSNKINVGFEPTIMYFTNSIYTSDYPFYVIPYSVGLNLRLQVKLN